MEEFWGYVASDHPQHAPDPWGVDRFFFQPDQDRTLLIEVFVFAREGDPERNYRIWLQRIDPLPSDVTVSERFSYPATAEVGSTLFREFDVRNVGSGSAANAITAALAPRGSCDTPSPGRLRCNIDTKGMAAGPAPVQFTFANAEHIVHDESVAGWPAFSVTLTERAITTRAQITGTGGGTIGLGASVSAGLGGGFALDFENDATIVEGTRVGTLGLSASLGFGAGVKLGWVEPRASAQVTLGGEFAGTRTVALRLTDQTDRQQQLALATWLLTSAFEPALEPDPLLNAIYTATIGESLQANYLPFVSRDSFGVTVKRTVSGSLGVFLGHRPDFDPFNFGFGTSAGASGTLGWEFDIAKNTHTFVFQADLTGALTFTPTAQLEMYFGEDALGLDLPNFGATGAAGMAVKFVFTGPPSTSSLEEFVIELLWGSTLNEQLENNSLTISFSGDNLRAAGGTLWTSLAALLDPDSINAFTPGFILGALATAINQVEGDVVLKTTQGTEFAPTFALGGEIEVGIKAEAALSVGGQWLLTVTQETDRWIILGGKLVKVSELAFTPTDASENTVTGLIADALSQLMDELSATTLLQSAWTSASDFVLSQVQGVTEAIVTIPDTVAEFFGLGGSSQSGLDIGLRLISGLSSLFESSQVLRVAQLSPGFMQSDLVELSPQGWTADEPFTLSIRYATGFAGPPEELQTTEGFTVLTTDAASGIDPDTATLEADGSPVPLTFDPVLGRFTANTALLPEAALTFRLADGAGNQTEIQTVVAAAQRVVTLEPGWNLVGWSGGTAIEQALESLVADVTSVFTWDAAAAQFLAFRPGQLPILNTLDELQLGEGVWLLTPTGGQWTQPPIPEAQTVSLLAGFNLVIWTGPDGTPVERAVASLGSALERLFLWDAAAQAFTTFSLTQPAFLNSASSVPRGAGVWIRMSRGAGVWIRMSRGASWDQG
ncbi:MAG TPA: hypothetical protein QGF05_02525 [Dehalococcoidia bacterium]|nr:hypothetical protein [Dehalococcoidia bacterium]